MYSRVIIVGINVLRAILEIDFEYRIFRGPIVQTECGALPLPEAAGLIKIGIDLFPSNHRSQVGNDSCLGCSNLAFVVDTYDLP